MDTHGPNTTGQPHHDLEDALQEWISASRRAYSPGRDPRDEQAEDAAWRRVRTVLGDADVATAV